MAEVSDEATAEPYRSGPLRETHQIPAKNGQDALGSFTLRLYWSEWNDDTVRWVDFELFEVISLDSPGTGRLYYERRGAISGMDMVHDLDEAQPVADGFVKGDGCTQFEVSSVHVDHRKSLEDLFHAIADTRRLCAMAMPGSDIILEYP